MRLSILINAHALISIIFCTRIKRLGFFLLHFDRVIVSNPPQSVGRINHPIHEMYNRCIGDNNNILDRFDGFRVYPFPPQFNKNTIVNDKKAAFFLTRVIPSFNEYHKPNIYHIYLIIWYIYIPIRSSG